MTGLAVALTVGANLLVGACIGLTGIAGFLLPIFYVGVLGLAPVEALALSFSAFVVSGLLGTPAYRATGDLPLRRCATLSAGSLVGAVVGVLVGLSLPSTVLTTSLYVVVLLSGISVLLRAGRAAGNGPDGTPDVGAGALVAVGAVTAAVCAATGAGGPVLVVPVLMLLGFSPRRAVAVGLLDSVAIAVPSAVGYLIGGAVSAQSLALLGPALAAHGVGVVAGSRGAARVDQRVLKSVVALGSVAVAVWRLLPAL